MDEILKYDNSTESYRVNSTYLSWGALYYAVQGGSKLWVGMCRWNPKVWQFKWRQLSSSFREVSVYRAVKMVLNCEYMDEILKCDHSIDSYWAVFFNGVDIIEIFLNWKFGKSFSIPWTLTFSGVKWLYHTCTIVARVS